MYATYKLLTFTKKQKKKLLIKKEKENTLLAFTILPTKSKSKETIL